jgi:hypothetical protein
MLRISLVDQIQQIIETYLADNLHTSMPAKIVSYDAKKNRATVIPTLPKQLESDETLLPAKIFQVPVVFPSSHNGKASLTFPVQVGDNVMLSVQQRSLEGWLDGKEHAPDDPRQFDISDSVAHTGLCHSSIVGDPDNVVLKFDKTTVTITKDNTITVGNDKGGITIDKDGNMTLKAKTIRIDTESKDFTLESHIHQNTQPHATAMSGPPNPS